MPETVIRANNLGKRYRIGEPELYRTLRDSIAKAVAAPLRAFRTKTAAPPQVTRRRPSDGYIWALRNAALEVKKGEIVGIIGPNGAGKTTLMKVLSRITEPTEGWAEIRGRMATLLEVGTGFHPELTGRENVYVNGAILGMKKTEIDAKFEEIVDFAELREFIDTPVKRYSSGMNVRLGFSVAAHLQPEILLVDEVLAVGDAAFQRRSMGKMENVAREGRTVLFVSHSMAAIQGLCTVAYYLNHGRILASGNVSDVIAAYLGSTRESEVIPLADRTDRKGSGKVRLTSFSISGSRRSMDTVQCGLPATLEYGYEGTPPLRNVEMDTFFFDQLGFCVLNVGSGLRGQNYDEIPPRGKFVCRFERFPLLPGTYHILMDCSVNSVTADWIRNAVTIHVLEGDYYGSGKLPRSGFGHVAVAHEWELLEDSLPPPPSVKQSRSPEGASR